MSTLTGFTWYTIQNMNTATRLVLSVWMPKLERDRVWRAVEKPHGVADIIIITSRIVEM